jgi:hypothetical protein
MTIPEKMKAKLFAAEILGDDGCSRGRARERKGQLQIVWDDGVVENIVRVNRCRVTVADIIEYEDKREHISVETDEGYVYLFLVGPKSLVGH